MINEDMTQRECNLAVRVGSLATNEIKKALDKLLAELEAQKKGKSQGQSKQPELKKGKQTLEQLQKHNEGLSTIELKDPHH